MEGVHERSVGAVETLYVDDVQFPDCAVGALLVSGGEVDTG